MNNPAVEILLAFAVVTGWLSALGIFVMRNPFDRLHFTGPITTLSSLAIIAAVLLKEPWSQVGVRLLLIFMLLLGTNSVLAHATALAACARKAPDDAGPRRQRK